MRCPTLCGRGPVGVVALAALLALGVSAGASAQGPNTPSIAVDETRCVPVEDNALITARVQPEVGGATVRLYFRWREHGTFYWVPMNAAGSGRYWAVLPKPEKTTETVERYLTVAEPGGRELARSASATIPVQGDCKVTLDAKQRGQAENLVIGETALPQKNRDVLGFLCDGIVSRVDADGVLRVDDVCRVCVVAWWKKGAAMTAPLVGIPSIIVTQDDPEPSPSRP